MTKTKENSLSKVTPYASYLQTFLTSVYLNPPFPSNYILSISASSGLIALLSTGSK